MSVAIRGVLVFGLVLACSVATEQVSAQPAPAPPTTAPGGAPAPSEQQQVEEAAIQRQAESVGGTLSMYATAQLCGSKEEVAETKSTFEEASKKLDDMINKYSLRYDPDVHEATKAMIDAQDKFKYGPGTQKGVEAAEQNFRDSVKKAGDRIKSSLPTGKFDRPTKCPQQGAVKPVTPKPAKRIVSTPYDRDLFYRLRRGERRQPEEERQDIGCVDRPTSIQLCSFTGPFVGAQFVGSSSRVGTSEFFATTGVRTNDFDDSGSGFGGGLNFGYNWQPWRNKVVVGAVFDANFLNDSVRRDFVGRSYIGSTVSFTASAQVRSGVLVMPNFLLYGQGGLSIANQQLKIDFGGPETNESKIVPGLTLGFGGEWMLPTPIIPLGKSTSLFADYQHTWWDTAKLIMPAASTPFNYAWRRNSDVIKLGARWHW